MDDAPFSFWSHVVFLFASPALLIISASILRQFWQEEGRFPAYWGCVHVVALCILAALAFSSLRGVWTELALYIVIAIYCWAAAIKISLDWRQARRAGKPEKQKGGVMPEDMQ